MLKPLPQFLPAGTALSAGECQPVAGSFQFEGLHLLASYKSCHSQRLRNLEALTGVLQEAARAAGATCLGTAHHVFANGGMTILLLLAESHASLHTYPEYDSCFIDIFTCGTSCKLEVFETRMREHLQPNEVQAQILHRSYDMNQRSSFWQSGPTSAGPR